MKRTIIAVLILLLATQSVFALEADSSTSVPSTLKRDIKLSGKKADGSFADNPVLPGISSTTGLPLAAGRDYFPILVQIDNSLGAIPQWGLASADIVYELPVSGSGWTRLTALFSDQYPLEAGPVRSARVMHADLREEWNALFLHFGQQNIEGSNFGLQVRDYGTSARSLVIEGIGNKYKDYFLRVRYHGAPHNVSAHVQDLAELVKGNGYVIEQRPYLFTDEKAYAGPDAVSIRIIHKENEDTASTFVYDMDRNNYLRFTAEGIYTDLLSPETMLTYSNVVIQRTRLTFNGQSAAPLLPDVVGTGAADIFIGGKYIAGAWARASAQSRTVFFDQDGNELKLQRGRTWIAITNEDTEVSYESAYDADTAAYYQSTGKLPLFRTLRLGDRGNEVKELKQRLYELGFMNTSKFNNQYQDNTVEAVRQFEAQNGLPVDGIADSGFLELIYQGMSPAEENSGLPEEDADQLDESFEPEEETDPEMTDGESGEVDEQPADEAETVITGVEDEPEAAISAESSDDQTGQDPDETAEDAQTAEASANELTAEVRTANKGKLNMRKSPDKKSALLEKIPNGSIAKVLEKGDDWTRILYKDQEGYVLTSFLVFLNPDASETQYVILTVGDSGPDVTRLKQRFYELGYFRGNVFSDQFVKSTADTVKQFEKRNGLPVDGIADVEMQKVLFSSEVKRP